MGKWGFGGTAEGTAFSSFGEDENILSLTVEIDLGRGEDSKSHRVVLFGEVGRGGHGVNCVWVKPSSYYPGPGGGRRSPGLPTLHFQNLSQDSMLMGLLFLSWPCLELVWKP